MKYMTTLALVAVAVVAGSYVWAEHQTHEHGDKPGWFDCESCDICKPMAEDPKLMAALKWETHKIKNGMLMVTIVPEEYKEKFAGMCNEMHAKGKELGEGKINDPQLCGFCQSYGKLMQAGGSEEMIKTAFGNISLFTAEKPATVKMIHEHAERSQEEAKKMEEMMQQVAAE